MAGNSISPRLHMNENEFFVLLNQAYHFNARPSNRKIGALLKHLSYLKKCNGSIESKDLDEGVNAFFSQELSHACYCLDTTSTISIMIKILHELNSAL